MKLLTSFGHQTPTKLQLSPHKHVPIQYSAGPQYNTIPDNSPLLDKAGILCIQQIVGGVLYYGREVNNKLLVALNKIGSQQVSATENTAAAVHQFLDYCAT